jgi:hypothetical protein
MPNSQNRTSPANSEDMVCVEAQPGAGPLAIERLILEDC